MQRTLVKSPPELWAELSDPGALARHLGELGEIRITRIEPEQLVEWEAENRTGTVHIKPSGWGTRVTLTVSTDVPETALSTRWDDAPPTGAAAPEAPAQAEHAPTAPAEDDPSAAAEEEPAAAAEDEPAPVAESAVAESAVAEDDAAAPVEDRPGVQAESIPSPLGAPLTAAAASSWRASVEPEDVGDPSLGWIAENGPELQAETPTAEEPGETSELLPYEEPEPRRGFFARLFGRRRRPAALDSDIAEESLEAISPQDTAPDPEPEAPVGEAMAESAGSPFAEDELVAPDADAPSDAEPAAVADLAEPPAADALADEPETDGEAPAGPIAEASPAVPEGPAPWADPSEQGGDLAAELKAAEETADAEVTAVLTSLLDRLGAAHHRPFSRS
ncbi:MAG TPA: hypothetical protein VGH78_02155 [Solirubrobacteraceae bacterium]